MRKQRNKPKIGDILKQQEAYRSKIEEYSKLSLDELKAVFNNSEKRIGGSYRAALIEVVKGKMQEQATSKGEIVSEMPNTENKEQIEITE